MHVGLHYVAQAAEYATPNNCNVLAGESLHKTFKRFAARTNHVNVEKALLYQEILYRTIQLVVEGAYTHSEPVLTESLQSLCAKCPTVFQSLLNRPLVDADEVPDIGDRCNLGVLDTGCHKQPRAWGCFSAQHMQKDGYPIKLNRLDVLDPFLVKLRSAYAVDYSMKSVIEPGHFPLQWCRKFTYNSGTTRRISLQIGDYVYYRGSTNIGRIKQIFIHEIVQDARRLFVYLSPVQLTDTVTLDDILQLPILRLNLEADAEIIVGLPGINARILYIVPYGKEQILQCTWEIDFM